MTPDERAQAHEVFVQSVEHTQRVLIRTAEERQRYERALRAMASVADGDRTDAEKVREMRYMAIIPLRQVRDWPLHLSTPSPHKAASPRRLFC